MTSDVMLWISLLALFITGLASVGAKALHDFSVSKLEEYCLRRKRPQLLGEILARHQRVVHGAESLQIVGMVMFVLAGGLWMLDVPADLQQLQWSRLFAGAAVGVLLLLVTTSWIPWAVTELWSAPLLAATWRLWVAVSLILWPFSVGVRVVDALMRRLAGRPESEEDEEEAFEDEILSMVSAGEREGLLEPDAREMIEGVIELGDADVADIMTPLSQMDALNVELSWPEVLALVIEAGRTRLPVYERTLDNIIGVLFVKDLLPELAKAHESQRRSLREILREPWFVPKTRPVDDMLQDFLKKTRSHLAIVVDEYDSVAGVVTIEDVLEEIVGEIVDESDKEPVNDILRVDEFTADVLGTTHIDRLNEELGLDLAESDDFDTIAGMIVNSLGRIPKSGESIQHGNVQIDVLQASRRRVERVRVGVVEDTNGRHSSAARGNDQPP